MKNVSDPTRSTPADSQPNTGRLSTFSRPPEPRRTAESVARKPSPPPSSWGDNLSLDLNLPKSPPLPPAADGKKVGLIHRIF